MSSEMSTLDEERFRLLSTEAGEFRVFLVGEFGSPLSGGLQEIFFRDDENSIANVRTNPPTLGGSSFGVPFFGFFDESWKKMRNDLNNLGNKKRELWIAYVLWFFLGPIGAHNHYL